MRDVLIITIMLAITFTANAYLIGKQVTRNSYGKAYTLVMEQGDFITQLQLQQLEQEQRL